MRNEREKKCELLFTKMNLKDSTMDAHEMADSAKDLIASFVAFREVISCSDLKFFEKKNLFEG